MLDQLGGSKSQGRFHYTASKLERNETKLGDLRKVIEERYHSSTINELWNEFKTAIHSLADKYIPSILAKSKDSLPYLTPEIKKLITKRDRLFRKRKAAMRNFENSTPHFKHVDTKYKELRSLIQKKLRQTYWKYIEDIITPLQEDNPHSGMKRFWGFIKRVKRDYVNVGTLKKGGKLISNSKEKADLLNKHFELVFTKATAITPGFLEHSKSLQMPQILFTEKGVQKVLEGLKVHKAAGPDMTNPRILKELAKSLAPILTYIFQKLYETGTQPDDWRSANIVPVFKKGKKSFESNYRPISLTCVACRTMKLCRFQCNSLSSATWFSQQEIMRNPAP